MLSNRVALVTGAAQGIGLAISAALLKLGAKVSLLDVREDLGKAACKELQKEHTADSMTFYHCDVTDKNQLWSAFAKTADKFGGLDMVCNNAGIGNEKNWRKMIDINLVAVIEGTYLGVEFMSTDKGHRGGDVINIASMGGLLPMSFSPAYCASKHGVVGFTRSMKDVLATTGVRVNCICPEFVDTPLVTTNLEFFSKKSQDHIKSVGLMSPELVAKGMLQLLLEDKKKVGAAMMIRPPDKISYFTFPDEQKNAK